MIKFTRFGGKEWLRASGLLTIVLLLPVLRNEVLGKRMEANFQASQVFHCEYDMEIRNEVSDTAVGISVPISIHMRLTVITDGKLYLIIGKPVDISVMGQDLDYTDEADTILIDKTAGKCFSFRDKQSTDADTMNISAVLQNPGKMEGTRIIFRKGSLSISVDSIYPKYLIPFPQITGNDYGITKIEAAGRKCSLLSAVREKFDFAPLLVETRSFRQSRQKVPMLFLKGLL